MKNRLLTKKEIDAGFKKHNFYAAFMTLEEYIDYRMGKMDYRNKRKYLNELYLPFLKFTLDKAKEIGGERGFSYYVQTDFAEFEKYLRDIKILNLIKKSKLK